MFKKFHVVIDKLHNCEDNILDKRYVSEPTDNYAKLRNEVGELMEKWQYELSYIRSIDVTYNVWVFVFVGSVRIIKIEEV